MTWSGIEPGPLQWEASDYPPELWHGYQLHFRAHITFILHSHLLRKEKRFMNAPQCSSVLSFSLWPIWPRFTTLGMDVMPLSATPTPHFSHKTHGRHTVSWVGSNNLVRSKTLWRWYINKIIVLLEIVHRADFFYLKRHFGDLTRPPSYSVEPNRKSESLYPDTASSFRAVVFNLKTRDDEQLLQRQLRFVIWDMATRSSKMFQLL
jgi:hypothetical protein